MSVESVIFQFSVWALPVLVAITMHEAAHGWAAWRLGDDTAYMLGRVSFNPIRHIDPFGTILLPGLLLALSGGSVVFGYAKPVPVNFRRLGNFRRDMVLVAAAGPGMNLALALIAASLMHAIPWLGPPVREWARLNLLNGLWLNVILAVFNMIPIPPLDGGRVAVGLLPRSLANPLARIEPMGFAIVLFAIFILPWIGGTLGVDLNVVWWFVSAVSRFLDDLIGSITGIA
ncbi:MAG: site-2 protease family protein [Rhodospirillales bacterium]|nr:site-2 protease family protein [Rhodospirillales bacterium]